MLQQNTYGLMLHRGRLLNVCVVYEYIRSKVIFFVGVLPFHYIKNKKSIIWSLSDFTLLYALFSVFTQQNKKEIKGDTAYIQRKQATEKDQNNGSVAYLEELVTTMTMDKGS